MDHSLGDSLKLEVMEGMDFESSDVVVNQADITLDSGSHEGDMAMEFEHIEEQPILMDPGNEEIIDFIGDQFTLPEYSIQDEHTEVTTTVDPNEQGIMSTQSETMIDLQFEPQILNMPVAVQQEVKAKPKYISVRAAPGRPPASKKEGMSRLVAIAPKLPRLVASTLAPPPKTQPIAPKPIAIAPNRTATILPKMTDQGKNQVIAQIGKQLLMMPSGTAQKLKLVMPKTDGGSGVATVQYIKAAQSGRTVSNENLTQLISANNTSGQEPNKPVVAKFILQGQQNAESAVLTKIASPRGVTQRVPVHLGNKVLMATPTKQGITFSKKQQLIAIKSPNWKMMQAKSSEPTTKKVVISANPPQNVILKTTAPPKNAQFTKDGKVVVQSQKSQIHQINVPGKGIQYIRLITNQAPATTKTLVKSQPSSSTGNTPKTFVLTDSKGNEIQLSTTKAPSSSSPYFVSETARALPKTALAWSKKLVTIPSSEVTSVKSGPTSSQLASRAAQSLLAPMSPVAAVKVEIPGSPTPDEYQDTTEYDATIEDCSEEQLEESVETSVEYEIQDHVEPESDSKAALRALVADALADSHDTQPLPNSEDNENSMEHLVPIVQSNEHPLIVISSNYVSQDSAAQDRRGRKGDSDNMMVNIETEIMNDYSPPSPRPPSEGELVSGDLGLKLRRACNCNKSQCLKLYCDCFANGEFCNQCNCNNCHNNLENEELRQKAIRACLERNPNAFRPKIGKSKTGGPDIIRRHNKGCNCKRSGCLKNYCECYEAKIACTVMCKCVGCRNVEDALSRRRGLPPPAQPALYRPSHAIHKQPCSFMTTEVIEAVCQCLIAASVERGATLDPVRCVLDEFSRCLQDVVSAAQQPRDVAA